MSAKKTARKRPGRKPEPLCLSCKRLRKRVAELEAAALNAEPGLSANDVMAVVRTEIAPLVRDYKQLASDYNAIAATHREEIEDKVEEALDHRAFLEEVAGDRRRLCASSG